MRSFDNHPTAHSWLHIFRILSLYRPLATVVRNANVDDKEDLSVLVAYNDCLHARFKHCDKTSREVKEKLREDLLQELTRHYVDDIPYDPKKSDEIKDMLIYDLCGYLIHTRSSVVHCENCKKLLSVDECDFGPSRYTELRTRGYLKFASVNMFKTFREVEKVISSHFTNGHIYVGDSFQKCLSKIQKIEVNPHFL